MKKIRINRSVMFALCLSVAVMVTLISAMALPIEEENIYSDVIRLHVIANSDSEKDQEVKLQVRDALLAEAPDLFSGSDIFQAKEIVSISRERLLKIAERVLSESGFDYGAKIEFGLEDYPEKEYDGIIFPAGRYLSLRVILGSGEGHNWWCVLFPPLCIGASSFVTPNTQTTQVKFKFKLLEWIFG